MSANLQLICFLVSFLYGIIFGLLTEFHFKLINHYSKLFQLLISLVFIIDIVLGYILIMYHLNTGIFHLYFFIFIFIGFLLSFFLKKWLIKYFKQIFKK